MKLKLELNLPDTLTAYDVENVLSSACELALTGGETNAEKTTVTTDNGHAVKITLDETARRVLSMTKDKAKQVVLDGWPCIECASRQSCRNVLDCPDVEEFLLAEREVLASKAFCNTSCDLYGRGTCPFAGRPNAHKDCEKYKVEHFKD